MLATTRRRFRYLRQRETHIVSLVDGVAFAVIWFSLGQVDKVKADELRVVLSEECIKEGDFLDSTDI